MKHTINRMFFSSRRTLEPLTYLFYLKGFSRWFKYKVPAGFHYSPLICYITHYTLRSRRFTWNTLLIDCSSHRGAHFSHWLMCSISNGYRDNPSSRFQRVSITRHQFVTSPTITWDPGDLQWNTLLIDCSSHRGAHFSHWDFCSISDGSRDNPSSRFQRVSITRH